MTDRNPVPTGVVSGPLRASRVRRMLSTVASGSGSPERSTAAMPAICSSQSNVTPVASQHLPGGGGDLRADAVARDQRDDMAHGSTVTEGKRIVSTESMAAAGVAPEAMM